MNSSISFTDPGAMLGKAFLRIGQVLLLVLAVASASIAYLAFAEMFSGWDIDLDSDLIWLFSNVDAGEWISYFFIGLTIKFLVSVFGLAGAQNLRRNKALNQTSNELGLPARPDPSESMTCFESELRLVLKNPGRNLTMGSFFNA